MRVKVEKLGNTTSVTQKLADEKESKILNREKAVRWLKKSLLNPQAASAKK